MRHKLTREERIRGMKSLLKNPNVGAKQKAGLKKALKKLER